MGFLIFMLTGFAVIGALMMAVFGLIFAAYPVVWAIFDGTCDSIPEGISSARIYKRADGKFVSCVVLRGISRVFWSDETFGCWKWSTNKREARPFETQEEAEQAIAFAAPQALELVERIPGGTLRQRIGLWVAG